MAPKLFPALGARPDETFIKQPLREDIICKHVQHSHVGARVDLKMVFCQPGKLYLQRVNDDKRYP